MLGGENIIQHLLANLMLVEEEIKASECFDKEGLVRAHELKLERQEEVMQSKGKKVFSSVVESCGPSVPLRGLKPITISELKEGCHHTGRVLHGELCVEPMKMVAVQTIVVDEAGRAAKLSIYNVVPFAECRMQRIRTLFPKGLRVAIKEPYLKRGAKDGCLTIRVDNPANLETTSTSGGCSKSMEMPESNSCKVHTTKITAAGISSISGVVDCARHLRSEGNKAFATEDWEQSVQFYTHAISALLAASSSSSDSSPSSSSAAYNAPQKRSAGLEVRDEELALVYSNRAEARIRLKHFEKAALDASKALELQPGHVKSMFRKGRALQCLDQYKAAVLCFQEALDLADPGCNKEQIREAMQASKQCQKQATTGEYDLPGMCKEVDEGRVPVCAEFIGDVAIGAASDKAMGRGLLVTRDVMCGELLLVSRAVADSKMEARAMGFYEGVSGTDQRQGNMRRIWSSSYHEDLVVQLVERARESERFKQQIYSLASDSTTVPDVKLNIPSIALFSPNESEGLMAAGSSCSSHDSIDVDKIRGVARTNAFELPGISRATLWLTPSFINHSCMPNASWITVGEALFVRAARNLKRGEEVTISYLDSLLPYALRAQNCQTFRGFQCSCERCGFEKTVEDFTRHLVSSFSFEVPIQIMAGENEQLQINVEGPARVAGDLEWALKHLLSHRGKKQKQWLRTSFARAYLKAHMDAHMDSFPSGRNPKGLPSLEAVVSSVQHTMGGAESVVMPLRTVLFGPNSCSPQLIQSLASMCVCLYGRQHHPAALQGLLATRKSLLMKPL